ncbi:MAG: DUF2147 domain-containing protein [Deltaproteobacteria bacterium]|nr:DUF2147 domain-containing protein [Deltaproteobacteria bacterium]
MKKSLFVAIVVAVLFSVSALWANSPVGKWKTIDDETKAEKSIVEIYDVDGKLYGKIIKILTPGKENSLCEKCTGEDKNKPLVGLVILKNLVQKGNEYVDGTIMDPNKGKVYSCKIALEDGGAKLKVRGFIGFSFAGRTQYWYRTN